MSRTIALALAFGVIGSAALAAAAERQLVAPNLSPGLKTVPYIHTSQDAGTCGKQLVDRIDSGTVVAGPLGFVAHLKGTISAASASDAQLVITSTSPDGKTANADFVACRSTFVAGTPAPVAAIMNLPKNTTIQSLAVRAQANTLVLYPSKAQ